MTQTITVKMDKDSEYYFVDASASDQGAVDASYDSAKDLIDSIGTSKYATLVFSHSGGGNTTTYTFSTSETIPRNIDVIVENGARITVATGITLTVNGAINVPLLQWISLTGTGKVDFSGASVDCVYPEWWGAARNGTTNDLSTFQAASASISAGTIKLLEGTYMLSTVFEFTGTGKHLKGAGRDATFITTPIDNNAGAISMGSTTVVADNCTVTNLTITRAAGTPAASDRGIHVRKGTNSSVSDIRITRQQHGIDIDAHDGAISTVVGFKVVNSFFDDVTSAYVRVGDSDQTTLIGNTFGLASETLDLQHCVRIEDLADNLLIANNTFVPGDDTSPDNGVYIDTYTGSGTFITITGNQFSSTDSTFSMGAAEAVNLTITGNKFDSAVTVNGNATYLTLVGNKMSAAPTLSGTYTVRTVAFNTGGDIVASKTWNPSSIAAGSYAAVAWSDITGAELGDFVLASPEVDLQNLSLSCTVIDTDTVECNLYNNTAGALDIASHTINIRVLKGNT